MSVEQQDNNTLLEPQNIAGDLVYGDQVGGDKVGGDKITVGDVGGSYNAIGAGAQVIVTQIQQALSAVGEMEKGIQAAERRLAAAIQQKIVRYAHLTAPTQVDTRENPYKALLDYKLEDAPFFYGRSLAVQVMRQKMHSDRLTILHSESGSGKTSLLQAGLASRLLADGHFPLYLRPYHQSPDQFIKKEFLPDYTTLPELSRFRDEQMSLKGFLERVAYYVGGRQIYLFLDQFEEFFTEQPPQTQRAFAEQMRECVASDLPVRWVLSLRKEYFSDLRLFGALRPFDNEYFLPTFRLEEAQEVVTEPAALKGVQYEAGLVDHILADLRQEDKGIPPAQVQLVCYTLFDELPAAEQANVISHALYNKPRGRGAGEPGAKGILTSHLTRVLDRELKGAERRIANRILEELVTSDVRRAVRSREHLTAGLEAADPSTLEHVLATLHENRLIRRDLDENDQPLYELTHDYLLSEIELNPETQARKAAQELLAQELVAYRQFGTLISKDRFDIIHSQMAHLKLEETAVELIAKSEDALTAEQQRELERVQQIANAHQRANLFLRALVVFLFVVVIAVLQPVVREEMKRREAMTELVAIPVSQDYLLGAEDPDEAYDELPLQPVTIPAFHIEKYEASNARYRLCVDFGGCSQPNDVAAFQAEDRQNYPVTGITALQAAQFCSWLGRRLPNELEWERVARGPNSALWPWADGLPPTSDHANFLTITSSAPVDNYPLGQSVEGVFNLVGNVWEWTASYDQSDNYDSNNMWSGNWRELDAGKWLIMRGSSYKDDLYAVTERLGRNPLSTSEHIGFRCAAD